MRRSKSVGKRGRGLQIALLPAAITALAWPSMAQKGPTDPQEVGAFLDGLFAGLMAERHIPGAVVLIVKDGRVLFAKGYGFADLDKRSPVDPQATQFRVASNSKLFTATAAMQLVEVGKLDLHSDVNRYLDRFQIEAAFGRPVTLADLLTHTAGFDDKFQGCNQPLEQTPPTLQDLAVSEIASRTTQDAGRPSNEPCPSTWWVEKARKATGAPCSTPVA